MLDLPTSERVDDWIRKNIHVKGRPEWIFVKIFTHGAIAEDHEAVLGAWRDKMQTYLEKNYNDGKNYVLHYVTAREAYNIAKAAEAGKKGNPNAYRDFLIPPYVNRYLIASVPFETISFSPGQPVLRFQSPAGSTIDVRFKAKHVRITGGAEMKDMKLQDGETRLTLVTKANEVVGIYGE